MALRIGVSLPVRELKDDLAAIRDFASLAEQLGFTHLRVPEQIARKDSGHLHEPLTLLAYLAGLTSSIELAPSALVLPARQTGLGIGVGSSRREFQALGQDEGRSVRNTRQCLVCSTPLSLSVR